MRSGPPRRPRADRRRTGTPADLRPHLVGFGVVALRRQPRTGRGQHFAKPGPSRRPLHLEAPATSEHPPARSNSLGTDLIGFCVAWLRSTQRGVHARTPGSGGMVRRDTGRLRPIQPIRPLASSPEQTIKLSSATTGPGPAEIYPDVCRSHVGQMILDKAVSMVRSDSQGRPVVSARPRRNGRSLNGPAFENDALCRVAGPHHEGAAIRFGTRSRVSVDSCCAAQRAEPCRYLIDVGNRRDDAHGPLIDPENRARHASPADDEWTAE